MSGMAQRFLGSISSQRKSMEALNIYFQNNIAIFFLSGPWQVFIIIDRWKRRKVKQQKTSKNRNVLERINCSGKSSTKGRGFWSVRVQIYAVKTQKWNMNFKGTSWWSLVEFSYYTSSLKEISWQNQKNIGYICKTSDPWRNEAW